MASNPQNHALLTTEGTPETSFGVTPSEAEALTALSPAL
jgi:hypothetical protein